ncbi:MAG: hypothetical protein R2711_18790 [Acidimicrobiales bacterium]
MRKLVVLLSVLALLATGCGDRGSDASGGTGGDTTAPADGGDGGGSGDFGDLKAVCGPSEGGGEVVDDPAEAQGVSADEIVVGTVADPGFQGRPGLNQELFDSGEAFVQWCNEQGGINGKTLKLSEHDAALTEYGPVIDEACDTDFVLVGGGAVQDNLWETTGAECGLVDIAGFAVTAAKAGLAGDAPDKRRTIQPLPNPGDRYPVGAPSSCSRIARRRRPRRLPLLRLRDHRAAARQGAAGPRADRDHLRRPAGLQHQRRGQLEALRHRPRDRRRAVHEVHRRAHQRRQPAGRHGPGGLPARGPVLRDQLLRPDPARRRRPRGQGVFLSSAFAPLEEADQNPATKQYLDLVGAVDGKVSVLGLQSMSAWLLFATMAKDCDLDGNLTRSCLLEKAAEVTEWTGGGLHAPANPGENKGSEARW